MNNNPYTNLQRSTSAIQAFLESRKQASQESTADRIAREARETISQRWTIREGRIVPTSESVTFGNDAVEIEGVCLYADLADSTELVSNYSACAAAKVYKAFLNAACKIIRAKGGEITAFDGDRVMAVFINENKNTRAVHAAWGINHAVHKVLNPLFSEKYGYSLRHSVGIDASTLFVAKTGIRNANDLVWVGDAANCAAKLSALRSTNYSTYITRTVYDTMSGSLRKPVQNSPAWTYIIQQQVSVSVYGSGVFSTID